MRKLSAYRWKFAWNGFPQCFYRFVFGWRCCRQEGIQRKYTQTVCGQTALDLSVCSPPSHSLSFSLDARTRIIIAFGRQLTPSLHRQCSQNARLPQTTLCRFQFPHTTDSTLHSRHHMLKPLRKLSNSN